MADSSPSTGESVLAFFVLHSLHRKASNYWIVIRTLIAMSVAAKYFVDSFLMVSTRRLERNGNARSVVTSVFDQNNRIDCHC